MSNALDNLYAMAVANPWWAWVAFALFWACGIGVALCLVAMLRKDGRVQAADDDEQLRIISRRADLWDKPTHQVDIQPFGLPALHQPVDIQPPANVIPWTRRVAPPPRKP